MTDMGSKNEFDVIVVGSGAAGLTTAVVAQRLGLSVIVLEKAAVLGGTTAYSGGGAWIPNNHLMQGVGNSDSPEESREYLRHVLGNHYDPEKIDAYVASGAEMLRFMEEKSEVRFYAVPLSDYQPNAPGAKLGRTLIAVEYDGRQLGGWLKKVRNPLPGFAAFGTMQTDPQHMGKFKSTFRSAAAFRFSAGRFGNFLVDLLRFGKGAHMANGNALVGRLLRSAIDAGATIWTSVQVTRLVRTNGAVVGVTVRHEGKELELLARRGVVLASGGFGGNREMVSSLVPIPEHHVSVHPETNVGDGIALGKTAGGALPDPNPDNGVWAPVSVMRDASGKVVAKYPHFGPDRAKPGSIIVDQNGDRFANEAAPYQDFVNVMHDREIDTAWFIADRRFLRDYGMGIALPAPLPVGKFVRNGYLIEARSLEQLAGMIGIDPKRLNATVDAFNRNAANGIDPDFGRGGTIYDHAQGDYLHKPSPNLRPIGKGPFYALALHPGDVSTIYGFNTSIDAEVLDDSGAPIAGLFAVGLDQNSVMKGFYPGGGSSIGPAMTFGYRAARKLAEAISVRG